MPRKNRPFARFLVIALVIFFLPIFVLAGTIAATGTVTVEVHERGADGLDLYIPVPALLLDLAVWAAPKFIPTEELSQARREIAPYRDGLELLADELAGCPNGVLVEVENATEHVRIVKGWRNFEVEVKSADAHVTVSVPARLLGRALDVVG